MNKKTSEFIQHDLFVISEEIRIEWTFETGRDFGDHVIQYLHVIFVITKALRDWSDVTKKVLSKNGLRVVSSVSYSSVFPLALFVFVRFYSIVLIKLPNE